MNAPLPSFATNPNTCQVLSLLQSNNVFSNIIVSNAQQLLQTINILSTSIANIPENILSQITIDITTILSELEGLVTNDVTPFINHLEYQISNLLINVPIATTAISAQLGLANSGCGLPTLSGSGTSSENPTIGMQVFFASITGLGNTLITNMNTLLQNTIILVNSLNTAPSSTLQGIVDNITANITNILSIGTNMLNISISEDNALSSVQKDLLNFSNANNLITLYSNPCAALVINAIGTSELIGYLNP